MEEQEADTEAKQVDSVYADHEVVNGLLLMYCRLRFEKRCQYFHSDRLSADPFDDADDAREMFVGQVTICPSPPNSRAELRWVIIF